MNHLQSQFSTWFTVLKLHPRPRPGHQGTKQRRRDQLLVSPDFRDETSIETFLTLGSRLVLSVKTYSLLGLVSFTLSRLYFLGVSSRLGLSLGRSPIALHKYHFGGLTKKMPLLTGHYCLLITVSSLAVLSINTGVNPWKHLLIEIPHILQINATSKIYSLHFTHI